MFESRSIASLSRAGISVQTRANSFHDMSLVLFGLSSNQPPAKKQCGEKGKANPEYEKESEQKMARLLEVSSQW